MFARRLFTIFVSAVTDEFESYRKAIVEYGSRQQYRFVDQQDLVHNGRTTLCMLDDNIKTCNVVIHLLGERNGREDGSSVPPLIERHQLFARYPSLLSTLGLQQGEAAELTYTQWEAVIATYHQHIRTNGELPIIVAVPKEVATPDHPISDATTLDKQRDSQKRHRARLLNWSIHKCITFEDQQGLC